MKGNLNTIISCFIIIVSIALCTLVDNNFELANIHFYLLVTLCAIDFAHNRTLTFQLLWLVSFIFILLSEMLVYAQDLTSFQWEHKFIFLANDAVLLGYHLTTRKKMIINETPEKNGHSLLFIIFLGIFYAVFMVYQIPMALMSMQMGGRVSAEEISMAASPNILLSTFMNSYRIVPLILGYYIVRINKGSKWLALLFSSPVFFLMMFNGSRFRLLFSLLPFLIICDFFQLSKLNLKKVVRLVVLGGLLLFILDFMMQTRRGGIQAFGTESKVAVTGPTSDYLSVRICQEGSPEGILRILSYIKTEVETNGYTYGKSTGFIFYFWIPRAIWPGKPQQLNAWIPQKYMHGVADGYSSSSGFCGEPFADFGYFSFIVFLLMGFGLKKADCYLLGTEYGKKRSLHSLFAAILIPCIPFIIRSPVTAIFSTMMNGLFVYFFYYIFFKKK